MNPENREPHEVKEIETRILNEGDCEIRESRTFTLSEIKSIIAAFEDLNPDELTAINQVLTAREIIVSINIVRTVLPKDSADGYSVVYNFMLNAKYAPGVNLASATTNIDRTFFDDSGMPLSGSIFAEYINGEWISQ